MIVAIVNRSSLVAQDAFRAAVAAVQAQVDLHLAPYWETRADLVALAADGTPPDNAWRIEVSDVCDIAGDVGYHSFDGRPIGSVGVKTSIDGGFSWTSTLSHEVLEMIVDPWVELCIDAGGKVVSLEICDPVEGQPYRVGEVEVEDFVLPAFYRPNSPGPWNYNAEKPLTGPLTLATGGYLSSTAIGDWKQDNAKDVREAKRVAAPFSRRAMRLRRRAAR